MATVRGDRLGLVIRRPEVAWVVAAVLLSTQIVFVFLRVSNGTFDSDAGFGLVLTVLVVCGAVVLNQQPGNRIGWIFLLVGGAAVVGASIRDGRIPALSPTFRSRWIGLAGDLTWPLGFPLLLATIPLLFPTGRAEHRWRWAEHVGLAGVAALLVGMVAGDLHVAGDGQNRFVATVHVVGQMASPAGLALVLLAGGAGVTRLSLLHRSGGDRLQRELRQLALLTLVMGLVIIGCLTIRSIGIPRWLDEALPAVVLVGYPVAITWAVLRHGLFEHTFIVNRSSLVRLAQLFALICVLGGTTWFTVAADLHRDAAFVVGTIGAFGSLSAARGAGNRLRSRLFGAGSDPMQMLEMMTRGGGPEVALEEWAQIARQAVGSPRAELTVAGSSPVVAGGQVDLPEHHVPLGDHGELGELVVAQRSAAEEFSPREARLLDGLGTLISAAVHHAHLAAAARDAERSLADVVHTERERVHRDLHDQLGPRLAGIGYLLSAVDATSATAVHLLRARDEITSAATDARRLAHDLRPRPVEQFGLGEAIRRHAAMWAIAADVHLVVDIEDLDHLAAPTADAVYCIALEAINNVERHARASTCSISLRRAADRVVLSVADDGIGLRRPGHPGVGLASMRQRAAELGGHLRIVGPPGTRIECEVPAGA